eukprot:662455_1
MENITTEDPIQYACWQCLGSFPTSDCLFNHLATVHDAEKDGESVESDDELVASGLALTACDKSSGCQESVSASSSPIISDSPAIVKPENLSATSEGDQSMISDESSPPASNSLKSMQSDAVFACHKCLRTFTRKGYLKMHQKSHPPGLKQASLNFRCSDCDSSYDNARTLKRHSRIHLSKKFKCKGCSRAFTHKGYRDLHERAHA